MASDRSPPHSRPRRQSIPLQDLSRPPDQSPTGLGGWAQERTSRSRARILLGNRQSFSGRVNTAYERVDEGSPPAHESKGAGLPHVTTPRNAHQPHIFIDDAELSPVNVENFQAAMGSVSISFESPGPSRPPAGRRRSTLQIITEHDNMSAYSLPATHAVDEVEQDNYFSPQENDRTPLTDTRFLQPISGAPTSGDGFRAPPSSSGHSRSHSRLGDDLPNMEARLGRPTSSLSARSLSPSVTSPLSRAGTILRKASQRVVNLSNEPDYIDQQNIRRQRSMREARMEEPPILPAMLDYAHDERTSPIPEKLHPSVSADEWQPHPNPLKGKSFGIFSPDNWIRLGLCELLVHPVTEPIILILILVQTVLLAIDSSRRKVSSETSDKETPKAWQASWINYGLLFLFIIYTVEIVVRSIVSGFIKNAEEYSTVDTDLGFRAALTDRIQTFFNPQKQRSTQRPAKEAVPQPSILRSFTNVQTPDDIPGHSRQQQRKRLARRAFMRHSFNRLDFLAVISFWISFTLSVAMIQPTHHVYIFKMLSCLRILRLLGLTSGTSVCSSSVVEVLPLTFLGHIKKSEESRSYAGQRRLSHRILLAAFRYHWRPGLQRITSAYMHMVRRCRFGTSKSY